jgi:hypothetical protein
MTTRRLARNRRQTHSDDPIPGQPSAQVRRQPDKPVPVPTVGIGCHGETIAPTQRQFQFRNLSDDPRLNLRLGSVLPSARGTG